MLDAIPQTGYSQAKPKYALAGCAEPKEVQEEFGTILVAAISVVAVLWAFWVRRRGRKAQ